MKKRRQPQILLSQQQLSNELRLPVPYTNQLVRVGVIAPDYLVGAGKAHGFRLSTVELIRHQLKTGKLLEQSKGKQDGCSIGKS